jgi:mono/diheme cytochrome c family protein
MRNLLLAAIAAIVTATTIQAADATAGKTVYERSCRSCHGANGTANPAISKSMKVEMKDLKSSEVQSMSDAELKKIIMEGKGKMKPIASLNAQQVDDVVAYMRTLK